MSKNVFAYFHELKDVDSRNEKKFREKKFGRGDLVTIERVDFRVKKVVLFVFLPFAIPVDLIRHHHLQSTEGVS